LKRLEEICRDVCSDFEAQLKEFNRERDHAHLLVIYSPKARLSELVNSLKGVSSRRLKAKVPGNLRRLERAKERGRAMVTALFRCFGCRRPY